MKVLLLGAALALLASTAEAAPQSKPAADAQGRQCFYAQNITSWRPVGDKGVNLQVNNREVYHLDLFAPCPQLPFVQNRLGIKTRAGGDNICTGLDVDVVVPQSGGLPITCQGAKLRQLSAAEVKALPSRERP